MSITGPGALRVVGAHGGAGESTIAALDPAWTSAGRTWPRSGPGVEPTLLVARSNATGLLAAQRAAAHWAGGKVPHADVLGLAIVADAPGRLPRPLRDLAALVAGGVPKVWHVPWVETWRLGEPVGLETSPRAVRQMVSELHHLLSTRTGRAGTN